MISCDTNILYAAIDSRSARHDAARRFLASFQQRDDFALCELVLVELYGLLRNPVVSLSPCSAVEAGSVMGKFRSHPRWQILDYPGPQAGIMDELWKVAAEPSFAYRRIYDVRLALTLRHYGVTEFATCNKKDFQGFGFGRVWDPL
ncbi:MAG TPA: PIN domain-containing protein [Kiritimatiellia bacterium]|nr:PIN domain-containing protein [Kiritimatiellia bacterium]